MSAAGAALFATINDLRQGGTAEGPAGVDLSTLNGKDVDYAIQEISKALAGADGDADKIATAMQEALAECLEGQDTFDASTITDAMLVDMMVFYMRECVYEQVIMDSGKAFQGVQGVLQIVEAERALHSLVDAVVDKHIRSLLPGNLSIVTQAQVKSFEQRALTEVWSEWEGYEA